MLSGCSELLEETQMLDPLTAIGIGFCIHQLGKIRNPKLKAIIKDKMETLKIEEINLFEIDDLDQWEIIEICENLENDNFNSDTEWKFIGVDGDGWELYSNQIIKHCDEVNDFEF